MTPPAPSFDLDNARGYFGPNSVTWQLYREPFALFGGVRALLLQVAHPSVADGVARYSRFQADPFGRGARAFTAMASIYMGSKKQAEQTAQHLWRMHEGIKGNIPDTYTANRSDLLLWVFATLTATTLDVYRRMPIQGLPADWPEQFYEESKVAARLLGIPEADYPADLQAFNAYFQGMLQGSLLGSYPVCKEVAQAIVMHPRVPRQRVRLMAAGWLPSALCARLGIETRPDDAARLERWLTKCHRWMQWIPRALRYAPSYHQAKFRIARASGKRPALAGYCYHYLGKVVPIPLGLPD